MQQTNYNNLPEEIRIELFSFIYLQAKNMLSIRIISRSISSYIFLINPEKIINKLCQSKSTNKSRKAFNIYLFLYSRWPKYLSEDKVISTLYLMDKKYQGERVGKSFRYLNKLFLRPSGIELYEGKHIFISLDYINKSNQSKTFNELISFIVKREMLFFVNVIKQQPNDKAKCGQIEGFLHRIVHLSDNNFFYDYNLSPLFYAFNQFYTEDINTILETSQDYEGNLSSMYKLLIDGICNSKVNNKLQVIIWQLNLQTKEATALREIRENVIPKLILDLEAAKLDNERYLDAFKEELDEIPQHAVDLREELKQIIEKIKKDF